jgi:hypothetical protein
MPIDSCGLGCHVDGGPSARLRFSAGMGFTGAAFLLWASAAWNFPLPLGVFVQARLYGLGVWLMFDL